MSITTFNRARLVRLKGESGASAVEMALILPVLLLFLAGIMDFGLVFNNLMSMRQGIGSSVRQGIVAQPGSSSDCSITGAAGATAQTQKLICLTKTSMGLDPADSRTKISFPTTKVKGGSLILCAQYPLDSTTSLFDPLLHGILKAKVEMRIEQDLSAFGSTSETALSEGDWTWCS
ncbi:MAG: TadE/TadG family type IV pilus assembly protein [Actinomycetota bacterium]